MQNQFILHTERLGLRRFTPGDTTFLIELLNSAGWLRYIGDRNVKTEVQAREYLENGPLKSYAENGFGLFVVEESAQQIPIGTCGLIKRDYLDGPDLGFAFLPAYHGRGYAFEMASALMRYAWEQWQLPVLFAISDANNSKSISLLKKLRFSPCGKIPVQPDKEPLLLFRADVPAPGAGPSPT